MTKQYVTTADKINQLIALVGEVECKAKFSDSILNFIRTQLLIAELPKEEETVKPEVINND